MYVIFVCADIDICIILGSLISLDSLVLVGIHLAF